MARDGFLTKPENLALMLNTDGVQKLKSSSMNIWPVYLAVTNFPPHLRMNLDHIILAGIWAGAKKPPMDVLLSPVISAIASLSSKGIEINIGSSKKIVRAELVAAVFDLPARSAVLNMKQYNGEYGCTCCTSIGKRLGGSRIYLPNGKAPLRTHSETQSLANRALHEGNAQKGVKGFSTLSKVLNIPHSIPLDYMHCILEGVTKLLINCWFNSKNHRSTYYLGRYSSEIDRSILRVKLPHDFRRSTRSIDTVKYWKASELRVFLLFLSLPLLKNYLPSQYVYHLSLLVFSVHLLLGSNISSSDIETADKMLDSFYTLMPVLYSPSQCTLS